MNETERLILKTVYLTRVVTDPFPEVTEWECLGYWKKKLGHKKPDISVHAAYAKGFEDAVKVFQDAVDRLAE